MDLFNKKKIKDLEEKCKILKENLEDRDTNMLKYQKEIDKLNNETKALKEEINAIQKEKWLAIKKINTIQKDKRLARQNERKNLEQWIIKCKRAEAISSTFKENLDNIAVYKNEFRNLRGASLNTKSKRIKYKKQRKLEESIENIYKALEEV